MYDLSSQSPRTQPAGGRIFLSDASYLLHLSRKPSSGTEPAAASAASLVAPQLGRAIAVLQDSCEAAISLLGFPHQSRTSVGVILVIKSLTRPRVEPQLSHHTGCPRGWQKGWCCLPECRSPVPSLTRADTQGPAATLPSLFIFPLRSNNTFPQTIFPKTALFVLN